MNRSNKRDTKAKNPVAKYSPEQAERIRQLTWVVQFAQEGIIPNDIEKARRLHEQLDGYLSDILFDHDEPDGVHRLLRLRDFQTLDEMPMTNGDQRKLLDEKLALIRTGILRIINDYLGASVHPLRVEAKVAIQRVIESESFGDSGSLFQEQKVSDDVRQAIKFQLLGDLAIAGSLLMRCVAEGCSRFFIRHYRQEFCSTACRNRTNFRKWYNERKSRLEAQSARGTNVTSVQTKSHTTNKRRRQKKA